MPAILILINCFLQKLGDFFHCKSEHTKIPLLRRTKDRGPSGMPSILILKNHCSLVILINTRLLARVDGRSICITKSSDGYSSTEDRDR